MKSTCEVHTWKRYKKGKTFQETSFQCDAPDCQYKTSAKALVGKRALCGFCRQPFNLLREHLRLATPHCGCAAKGTGKENELESVNSELLATTRIAGIVDPKNLRAVESPSVSIHLPETIESLNKEILRLKRLVFDLEAAGQAQTGGEEKIFRKNSRTENEIDKFVERLIKKLMKEGVSREKAEQYGKTMSPKIE